jgi:hypothetical protein
MQSLATCCERFCLHIKALSEVGARWERGGSEVGARKVFVCLILQDIVSNGVACELQHTAVNLSFPECLREFLQIQRHSPPVERHQLEAFGGTSYDTLEYCETSF